MDSKKFWTYIPNNRFNMQYAANAARSSIYKTVFFWFFVGCGLTGIFAYDIGHLSKDPVLPYVAYPTTLLICCYFIYTLIRENFKQLKYKINKNFDYLESVFPEEDEPEAEPIEQETPKPVCCDSKNCKCEKEQLENIKNQILSSLDDIRNGRTRPASDVFKDIFGGHKYPFFYYVSSGPVKNSEKPSQEA